MESGSRTSRTRKTVIRRTSYVLAARVVPFSRRPTGVWPAAARAEARPSWRRRERPGRAALDVHPRVAMQILRHSKIAVTMEIYTEIPSAATRDALRKLSQWLDS